ncbi:MAG: carboxypeptidase regulatory-like domain-containing protein, partial [Vicinamibacterales bacterium]
MSVLLKRSIVVVLASVALVCGADARLRAQDRSLGKEDIILLGLGLRVEPDHQTVPRDVATIVSTFLATSTPSPGEVPPFAPGAIVRATLRGPGVGAGLALTASPNSPFNIPPLSTAGIYTLDDIRLESGGELLMRGVPESVTIEVIEKLLVTQVTARALSAQEIREKGIVFDKSNFQAYNFTAAFAVQDTPIHISFPVLLPTLQGARDITLDSFSGGGAIPEPTLPQLKTIIPDTLRLQTQLPNLQVVGFSLLVKDVKGQSLAVPPIPGIVVIPGDIGFLNQVFSVLLLVGNVAPPGSNLVVDNLTGEIHLPAGNDTVVGSSDDPLRLAMTANGPAPGLKVIAQPGPDGIPGSADDLLSLAAGQNGSAEFLVEGRREGTWVVEFGISGTLLGLPVGPVQVTGRAAGSVLVRNPSFTLTFTHPEVVMAREPYTLDVTVTNTSASPANFVSVNLHERHVTGATVSGEPTREIESIPAGESATVSFDLVSRVTGRVTAATLDADDPVQGRFALKTSVGELGVPVSPDSLVLPREASALPTTVRNEALSLVGKAWAVATAPTAALPRDVPRLSKQIVLDRAVQIAEAGFRISLHEPPADSAVQLAMDFIGSDFTRLASLSPGAGDLEFARQDFTAFDDLRRRSVRGDTFASAVGKLLAPDLASRGAAAFHRQLAEKVAYRPAHLSVLAVGNGPLPYTISLVDAQGRRIGRVDDKGKVIKQIPFGDLVPVVDQAGALMAQLIMLTAPEAGEYHVQFDRVPGVTAVDPVTVSLVVPSDSGGQRQIVYSALTANSIATSSFTPGDSYRVVLDLPAPGSAAQSQVSPDIVAAIVPPAPHVIGVVQQADKDLTLCAAIPLGRVLAVLFSSEVTPASVQDRLAASAITNYALPNNRIVGVALQPGRRIAFLGLRDGVGPFVPRDLTISAVMDSAGHTLPAETVPVEMTVDYDAAVVSGRVLEADGMPVPFASVRFLLRDSGATCDQVVGVSAKSTDDKGAFSWDWLPKGSLAADFGAPSLADEVTQDRIAAFNPATEDGRGLNFTIQRRGIRLDANIVFLGRGTLRGRTLAEDGTPLVNTVVRVTSLTDQSSYGMNTNAQGEFVFTRVPVGNVLIEAVNVLARSKGTASELIPLAGGTTVRDVRLFDLSSPAIVVKYGAVTGHVLKGDGASAAADVPVMAYYLSGSQLGVLCPGSQTECAVGAAHTDSAGRFQFDQISAGQIRLATFDQTTLQQGEARVTLPGNGTVDARILLAQGLGTVNGSVINTAGEPVAGARVGGGLSLGVTDASGHFTLTDVPVGRRDIRAVDDQNGTQAEASVDVLQAGQIVNVTIVLPSTGSIAGTVFQSNGSTPVPNQKVYLFFYGSESEPGVPGLQIQATAVTDASGRYTMARIPLRDGYTVSAFRPDFTDGNLTPVVLKFNHQAFRGDIVFRGGGGHVTGRVLDANGTTPLRAAVGISGDRVRVAGGLFVVGFQHVVNYQVANMDLATGAFAFDGVFTGPFTITAAGQFSPDPIGVESAMPSAGATIQLDVRLLGTSSIAGTVYQPDGVTPAGPDVIVRYRSSAFRVVCAGDHPIVLGNITIGANECDDVPQGIQDETVITDAAGRYLVPLVTGGPFTLTAEDPASGRTAQTLGAIKPGQSGDFSIRLLGVSTLTIRVRGSDTVTPIPGARVEVTQVSFPKQAFVGVADASGVLIVSGGDAFTEGDFTVKATDLRNGFAGRASGRVTGDGDVATTVFLYNASGTVFGTVFKADGLTRVPNAEVVISNPGGSLAFAVTDGAGDYRQDFIPLGSFRIDVFEAATARRGFAVGRVDLDRQDVPVDVTEAARGLVTGTAFAEGTLAPLKNWQVGLDQAAPGGGRSLPTLQTTTDIDGTFSLPGVTVGDFRVTVFKPWSGGNAPSGQATATSRLDTDGQRVDLPIVVGVQQRRYGRVEGTVFNPDGTPAADIAVDVCAIAACSFGTSGALHAQTAGDGTFAFDHVVTGRFVLTAKSQLSANGASVEGDLLFEGDVARLTLSLVGVSQISGTVVFSDGSPAGHVQLVLTGQPSSGCDRWCTGFADDFGAFTFINVPAHTFWVSVTDPVSGLNGGIGGTLTAGEHKDVRIVLQATSVVSGRILTAGGAPAARITVELIGVGVFPPPHLFQVTDENGLFRFPAVLNGSYAMTVQDPLGPGLAQRTLVAAGVVALGDIVLDEAPPSVASISPQASTIGIPLNAIVRLEFSEPVNLASLTPATVSLTGPSGPILATRQVSGDDNVVVLTPLAPLVQNTRYSVTVRGLTDRIGKTMASPFTASFTTIDLTPPEVIDLTPGQGGSGIALTSVIRIKYSEPVDPSKVVGPPVVLSAAGTAIQGITAFILGNTTLVFTPLAQLDENSEYRVRVAPAVDLAGNAQPQALSYVFRTLDRTPPQVVALTPAGDSTVTENGVTNVSADVGTSHDIAVVDFSINDQPNASARTSPFRLSFQAIAALGKPGDRIKISALATDTSGNRGVTPAVAFVTIVADRPPTVTVTSPAPGTEFRTGDRVSVTVHVTDDLGVTQVAYRGQTGHPQDAGTQAVAPSSLDVTRTFAFSIGADAVPGEPIVIGASATDSKGQVATASPVTITVLDATPPVISITGTTTGARVSPGQQTSAIVSAQDLGGVSSISFTTGGVLVGTQTRPVAPARSAVVTSFAFTVPASAHAGDILTLDATATDASGNVADAGRVLLPIADLNGPSLQLRTSNGSPVIAPGSLVNIVAQANDETGVASIALVGQGAFSVAQARQVTPISNSPELVFQIQVPAGAIEGAVLNVSAAATDIFGNVGAPATLTLTVQSLTNVVLPPSVLIAAGETLAVDVQLTAPSPSAGLQVALSSSDPAVAQVESLVQFAAGESTKSATLTGVRGGNASITASINAVQRATMTVTVRGGVVSGVVLDPQLQPVAGAQVTVTGGNVGDQTVTDEHGVYAVEGVTGNFQGGFTAFTVKVLDPSSGRIGFASGFLSAVGGFAHVNVVLVSAGSISGTVTKADGLTAVSAGARVDLFAAGDIYRTVLGTTLTDAGGAFDFPIVSPGRYLMEASDGAGNRGRSAAVTLATTGQHVTVAVAYLGRGALAVTVRDGAGHAVANTPLTLAVNSLFGQAPLVTANAAPDGTYRFDDVFVGTFTVQARDPLSNTAATASGSVGRDGEVVPVDLRLAQWGSLTGTVFRTDGTTPVAGARVSLFGGPYVTTTTDNDGHYAFTLVPLGGYWVEAREPATHGIGRSIGALTTHGLTVTQNVTFLPQGTMVVTVVDGGGSTVGGASVTVSSSDDVGGDTVEATAGADGVALVEHVLASSHVTVGAHANGLVGYVFTTLQPGELKTLTVALASTGSIVGTVFLPDGQTPATTASVALCDGCAKTPVGPDGAFRFDVQVQYRWTLVAYDGQGRKRAISSPITITQHGQLVTANMTLIGIGSVTGRVLNPDNSSAPNLLVTVRSLHPDFGSFTFAQTDAGGFYEVPVIVAGPVSATTGDAGRGLLGEAFGTLARDGDTLNLDILLKNNAVTFPATAYDGNAFPFDVQKNGAVGHGYNGVFAACCNSPATGASRLEVVVNGSATPFIGADIGTTEDGGREIVASQLGVAGLNVTRKVFVSPTYFARYLELITNPTLDALTVDLRVQHLVHNGVQLVTTSSGDAALDVSNADDPDRWLTVDAGADLDPFRFQSGVNPQVGFGWDGAGAARRVSAAAFTPNSNGSVVYEWSQVTIRPGETVAFMHFAVQQYSAAAARASLARLVQLPPEALSGLSQTEIGAIQNFAVPANGTSTMAPLPPLGGTITGTVFEADGLLPVSSVNIYGLPDTLVRMNSSVVYFGRTYPAYATATGTFSFGANITVPLAPFTLDSVHPRTHVVSPPAAGGFEPGSSLTSADVVFSNTGIVRGVVRRSS